MAKKILHEETLPGLALGMDVDAYDRKVLAAFSDAQRPHQSVSRPGEEVPCHPPAHPRGVRAGVTYPEKRVNQILARYSADTATLRRSLVEHGFMAREGGGGMYWRVQRREGTHGERDGGTATSRA